MMIDKNYAPVCETEEEFELLNADYEAMLTAPDEDPLSQEEAHALVELNKALIRIARTVQQ